MKFYNKIFIIAFIALSFIGLYAKDYPVITNNDDILCTLKTISQSQMLNIIGNLGTHQIIKEGKNQTINCFKDASKKYMAVVAKIKNNSEKTIYINKDEYIDGISDILAPMEEIIEIYEPFISAKISQIVAFLFANFIFTICITVMGILSLHSFKEYFLRRESFFDSAFFGLFGAFGILFTLGLIAIFGYIIIKDKKSIDLAKSKKFNLENYNYMKNAFKKHFSSDQFEYAIKPRREFIGIFFINIQKASRKIFDKIPAKLNYSFY